jgi:broad specificity phosphatase PhoE
MLEQFYKQYSDSDKVSLLIRHANRDKIPTGSFGNEVMLNEAGKTNALKFGEALSDLKINKIMTSPIGRCVQTGEFIAKGYGKAIDIIETKALGAPGLHITDEKIAGKFFMEQGFEELYRRIINDIPISGIPDAKQFNQLMTDFLIENTKDKGLTIFVTHDLLIAFYHYSINKTIYTRENWVKYLDGLILKNGKYEE